MIRKLLLFAIVALATAALAAGAEVTTKKPAPPPTTLTGELVDTGCYLSHGARGEKHVECATKCISGGMPMGLLTADGKLYLITLNHDNPDPYGKLKDMAGKTVSVTGVVSSRNGMTGIDVTDVKLAAATPAK
jgi:hypothetical protein